MLYVFYGQDQFRAREELQKIRRDLDSEGNLAHNTIRLEGKVSAGELRAACHVASFFAESRLVIVEGLQARFSGMRRRGRARATGAPTDLDDFVDVLATLPPTTTVVLLDETPATAFVDAVKDFAKVEQFVALQRDALRSWAIDRAKSNGTTLAPAALDRLMLLIDGHHLGELAQEIDKLATYANGRKIEVSDVDELVSGAIQYQIWDLTDAVVAGRADRALSFVETMQARGGRDYAPQLLIYMLTREFRRLILAKALLSQGYDSARIGEQLGINPGFPLRKAVEQAGRWPSEHLDTAYRRLLETDVASKTGVMDVDTALELLIVDLTELSKAPRRGVTLRR